MIYLFAVYFVLWAMTFGYVLSLGARQKRLQRELELLGEDRQWQ
jgi:CcmD family protein